MKHSRFLSYFSGNARVWGLLFAAIPLLLTSIQAQSSYILEDNRLGREYFSSMDDPLGTSDIKEEEILKLKLPIEHIDSSVICMPGTVLAIPDTSSGDTFHHKTKVLAEPDLIRELRPIDSGRSESRFDPSKQPKFTAFQDRQNFKHFLRYRDFDESVKALGYRNIPELDEASRAMFKDDEDDDDTSVPVEKFHWRPAILQSLMMQGVQHGYALVAQEKTRRALKGPFFRDYWRSLKGLSGWDDGNRFFTNYIAHPMQGAMTGFIYVQNHDRVKKQMFAESPEYWRDRLKIFVWSTAWSTQWELGPISQSTIGNVGMYGGMAYVDLVITPTVGTTWMVTEEALDRYVIRHIESKNFFVKVMARMFLNPMRTTANLLRFKQPWYRDRPVHP